MLQNLNQFRITNLKLNPVVRSLFATPLSLALLMLIIVLPAERAAHAHTHQPVARKTLGISFALLQLQDAGHTTLKSLKDAYVGGPNFTTRNLPRYAYSSKWGWIDFKHFFTAAYYSSLPFIPPEAVLIEGEKTELTQEKNGEPSAWSYEDLPSNLLGAYFAIYLKTTVTTKTADSNSAQTQTLDSTLAQTQTLDTLRAYFLELGFSENPLRAAPNGAYLLEQEAAGIDLEPLKSAENRDYMPHHTQPGVELNALDGAVIQFRERYLFWRQKGRT